MAKPKSPLFGFNARGSLAKLLTFRKRGRQTIAEAIPTHPDARTPAQLEHRTMFQMCTNLWHTLSETEKRTWESIARPFHMTGYAYYQSQCLKPNPGIYLPLAGGTMTGDIDMATKRILNLPAPVANEEPARKTDLTTQIAAHAAQITGIHAFDKSCRVTHSVNQVIPNAAWTTLAFNTEIWDTDNIHDTVTNNSRLICKTAGNYQIGLLIAFADNATGFRNAAITHNIDSTIAQTTMPNLGVGYYVYLSPLGLYKMAVNEYLIAEVWQNSGGNLNVLKLGVRSPIFFMVRIP